MMSITTLSPQERRALLTRLLREKGHQPKTAPLSFAQERLWFLDQLEPGNPTYNMPAAVRLNGRLDVAALRRSLDEVVRRHETLRTTFGTTDGRPVQVIAPFLAVPLTVIDLQSCPEAIREIEAWQLTAAEARRPFDLARGPLFRATLLRLDAHAHALLLTMHHVISDGWSVGVLIRELAALYQAFAAGEPSPLPELPVQYADFAAWQREWLQGEVLETQLACWKRRLAGDLPLLELPTDRPRPPLQTYEGARLALDLPAALVPALRALSQRENCSLFMTLLAAFETLLFRYTGQTDVLVGSPIAGRSRREVEGLIGFFLNTLVLRTDLSGEPSFCELLGRVREVTLEAFAHQDLPFEKLLEELQPARDLSRTPLFQVFFNMLNLPLGKVQLPGLTIENLAPPQASAKFDVTLYIREQEGEIHLDLVYNADLFDRERMLELLAQYRHLLEQVADDPERSITRFSLVTPEARQRLPDPARALGGAWRGAVHTHFSQQARRAPESLAITAPHERWTYGELEARSNQLARYLLDCGVARQEIVAIYGHRSASLVWAVLGVLKAGAAFVILDPAYPVTRLIDCLERAQPRGWLQVKEAGAIPEALQRCVERLPCRCRLALPRRTEAAGRDFLACYSPDGPDVAAGPDDLAYVAFTSGSTGAPKGILGRHGPLSYFIPWQRETFDLSRSDRYSMLSGLSHDPLQRDIFTALALGATLCIPDPEQMGNPGGLAGWMRDQAVSVAHLTPALLQLLAFTTPGEGNRKSEIPSLRLAFIVGDVLAWRDVTRLRALAPGVTCVNLYGATETQRAVGYFLVPGGGGEVARDVIPLGRGMPDVQLLVLNAAQELAGVGELGEIYVRSPHLARGYLCDDALTRERFVANPVSRRPQDRLYRTGDLGRYLPDGNVLFQGRADDQVKIRGFRVELGEVEAALERHPAVGKAVALACEDAPGDKRLVAYVVPERGAAPTSSELRRFLQTKLPDYMLPAAFVKLDALPLTPNGKLDRRALPAPEHGRPELEQAFVAPRTPFEETLAGIWAQILGLERVGVHDNFFELGGHSLLATQVISRVRRAFQVELPLRALFEAPTTARLAERIETARREACGLVAPPIVPATRAGEMPLSFAQQRLWFLDQWRPGHAFYNIASAVRLAGLLDVAALAQSFQRVIARHEALRTTFAAPEGRPVQVIAPALRLKLPLLDLRGLSQAGRETEARRLAAQEAQHAFDLARGPLVRAILLQLGPQEHVLLLTLHHIISDGWSTGVLIRELATLYQAFSMGETASLPDLCIQYADFGIWQRGWLRGEVLERQLAYWKEQLRAAPAALELPTDRPRPPVQTLRGATHSFVLPESLTGALNKLSRRQAVTLFMTLLAAFKVLLYRYTGQADVVVGSPIANRNRREIEGLIGFFVNTLALRTDLSGNPTFRELLGRVREVTLGAHAHQDLPFEMLVEELQPVRDPSRAPLFQVMFVLQNTPVEPLSLSGLTLRPVEIEKKTARFDLTLSMVEANQRLRGVLEYNTDLFDATTITRLADHFRTLLTGVVADPEQRIFSLPLLAEAERRQLLVTWNATGTDDVQARCFHELFQEQVEQTPDAVALVWQDEHVTYRALNRRANQLAHHLRGLGVGPETRVGLCVGRSPDMIVGILGTLKAGGAYVPLDPAYPAQRLAFMLKDARVTLLLAQERLLERLPPHSAEIVCLDADWARISPSGDENPPGDVTPGNLAYAIYTSGSTGVPKGVLLHHRGLCNVSQAQLETFALTSADRVLQFASLSFDASVFEIVLALRAGATLCLGTRASLLPGPGLVQFLQDYQVTVATLTPSALAALPFKDLSNLRIINVAGEACPTELVARWREGRRFFNLYGPTEGTIWTTAAECDAGVSPPPIGRPIANTQVYVLDPHLQPLPVGVPGELCIGGVGLARGYLNRPALTAERFVPNPFPLFIPPRGGDRGGGMRLYRSGDLARYLPDGNIEFLGRIDHQVKLRGFRIEPGEIEAVLRSHPSVREAVALLREDALPGHQLVAYVVARDGQAPAPDELRRFMQQKLPGYMLPSAFVTLKALPLTPSGKVDRRALPAPDQNRPQLKTAFVPPRTPTEQTLANIWAELLDLEQVGIHDDFFDLGGHSLLATQVVSRARATFQVELPLQDLFETPTVAGLAQIIAHILPAQPADSSMTMVLEGFEEGKL